MKLFTAYLRLFRLFLGAREVFHRPGWFRQIFFNVGRGLEHFWGSSCALKALAIFLQLRGGAVNAETLRCKDSSM